MDIRAGFRIVMAAAVVALAISCSNNDSTAAPDADPASSSPASMPNPGSVFEGTYAVSQVQETRPDLVPTGQENVTSTFSVKSFCDNDAGCVASALVTYPDAVPPPTPQPIVLDYVDGRWVLNNVFPALSCTNQNGTPLEGPYWQVATFEQPEGVDDGSMITGTGTTHSGPPCAKQFDTTYTFTRTGPLDPTLDIPPPDKVPPLVKAAGSALSGTYDFNLTPLSSTDGLSNSPVSDTGNYQSFCTRTGERCVSVIDTDTDILPMLEWTDGTWSSDATYGAGDCDDGSGQQQTTIRATLTNTDPNSSPAQNLSGEIRKIYVGDCPGEVAWTIAATRTGN